MASRVGVDMVGRSVLRLLRQTPVEILGRDPWKTWCEFLLPVGQTWQSLDQTIVDCGVIDNCLVNRGTKGWFFISSMSWSWHHDRLDDFSIFVGMKSSPSDHFRRVYCEITYTPTPATLNMPVYHWLGAEAEFV